MELSNGAYQKISHLTDLFATIVPNIGKFEVHLHFAFYFVHLEIQLHYLFSTELQFVYLFLNVVTEPHS